MHLLGTTSDIWGSIEGRLFRQVQHMYAIIFQRLCVGSNTSCFHFRPSTVKEVIVKSALKHLKHRAAVNYTGRGAFGKREIVTKSFDKFDKALRCRVQKSITQRAVNQGSLVRPG